MKKEDIKIGMLIHHNGTMFAVEKIMEDKIRVIGDTIYDNVYIDNEYISYYEPVEAARQNILNYHEHKMDNNNDYYEPGTLLVGEEKGTIQVISRQTLTKKDFAKIGFKKYEKQPLLDYFNGVYHMFFEKSPLAEAMANGEIVFLNKR